MRFVIPQCYEKGAARNLSSMDATAGAPVAWASRRLREVWFENANAAPAG